MADIIYPTIPRDYLLIKVDRQYNDKLNVAGQEIELDTSYDPTWHVRIYGEVVSLPKVVTLYDGDGRVKDESPFPYVHDVKVGDRVYFHFHTVSKHNRIDYLQEQNIYKLHHKQVFCAVRYEPVTKTLHDFTEFVDALLKQGFESVESKSEGYTVWQKEDERFYQKNASFFKKRIIMCNDRILVHPKKEPWSSCVMGGKVSYKVPEPKCLDDLNIDGGIIIKSVPDNIPLTGVVKHAPAKCELSVGEDIYFSENSEFRNEIEGVEYYLMYTEDVVGRYIHECSI